MRCLTFICMSLATCPIQTRKHVTKMYGCVLQAALYPLQQGTRNSSRRGCSTTCTNNSYVTDAGIMTCSKDCLEKPCRAESAGQRAQDCIDMLAAMHQTLHTMHECSRVPEITLFQRSMSFFQGRLAQADKAQCSSLVSEGSGQAKASFNVAVDARFSSAQAQNWQLLLIAALLLQPAVNVNIQYDSI